MKINLGFTVGLSAAAPAVPSGASEQPRLDTEPGLKTTGANLGGKKPPQNQLYIDFSKFPAPKRSRSLPGRRGAMPAAGIPLEAAAARPLCPFILFFLPQRMLKAREIRTKRNPGPAQRSGAADPAAAAPHPRPPQGRGGGAAAPPAPAPGAEERSRGRKKKKIKREREKRN